MDVHREVAELVRTAGSNVLDDADALRAALDDFLADDAATAGELNLLVDAVRLGALARFVDQVGHGADPRMTIEAHGDQLAAARGTRESGGTRWALAALGYAVGIVDEELVRSFHADMVGRGPNEPAPVRPPAPPPPRPPAPTMAPPTTYSASPYGDGIPPTRQTDRKPRAVLIIVAVAAVIVLAVGVGLGVWLQSDDEPSSSGDESTSGGAERPSQDDIARQLIESEVVTDEEQADCIAAKVVDSDLGNAQLEAIAADDESGLSAQQIAEVGEVIAEAFIGCSSG